MKTFVDWVNDMFLIVYGLVLVLLAVIILLAVGQRTLAYVISYGGTFLLLVVPLVGIVLWPRQTRKICSSDWLVNLIVRLRRR